MRIAKVRRCVQVPANTKGRDLVVGDLHGHRSLLEAELERLNFDPLCDRVFSVGDLINRGPESFASLALIEEKWFHAVLGNHELMLLNHLDYYSSRIHSRKAFANGNGQWLSDAAARNKKLLRKLADRLAELPLALHVEGERSFNVTHGDLYPLGARQESLFSDELLCVHRADAATTSRANIGEAQKFEILDLRFEDRSVQITDAPIGELPITYVGHSKRRHVTIHNSYVYIDQGVCGHSARSTPRPPTVIDHTRFSYWLGGVVTARERLADARPAFDSNVRPGIAICPA